MSDIKFTEQEMQSINDKYKEIHNPITSENAQFLANDERVELERRMRFPNTNRIVGMFNIVLTSAILKLTKKTGIKLPGLDARKYVSEMIINSDYQKFDNYLRMVLDCSEKCQKEILALLQKHYDNGDIYYGYNLSKSALMTCMVHSLDGKGHIHFIDGAGGGYTLAATMMKKQMMQ